jgi:hypothetical protein
MILNLYPVNGASHVVPDWKLRTPPHLKTTSDDCWQCCPWTNNDLSPRVPHRLNINVSFALNIKNIETLTVAR